VVASAAQRGVVEDVAEAAAAELAHANGRAPVEHPLAETVLFEQEDRPVLDVPCFRPRPYRVLGQTLEDNAVDACPMKQVADEQTSWAGPGPAPTMTTPFMWLTRLLSRRLMVPARRYTVAVSLVAVSLREKMHPWIDLDQVRPASKLSTIGWWTTAPWDATSGRGVDRSVSGDGLAGRAAGRHRGRPRPPQPGPRAGWPCPACRRRGWRAAIASWRRPRAGRHLTAPQPPGKGVPTGPRTRTQAQRTKPRPPSPRRRHVNPPELSDPTATTSTSTTTQHPASTRRGAVCNPTFRLRIRGLTPVRPERVVRREPHVLRGRHHLVRDHAALQPGSTDELQ